MSGHRELDVYVVHAIAGGHNLLRVQSSSSGERAVVLGRRGESGVGQLSDRDIIPLSHLEYLRITADMHDRADVEMTRSTPDNVTMIGAAGIDHDVRTNAQLQGGHFHAGGTPVAYHLLLDPVGQETWTLFLEFESFAQLQRWQKKRGELVTEMLDRLVDERFDDFSAANRALLAATNGETDLEGFDLEGWASAHGFRLGEAPQTAEGVSS